jgi:hypothetical protein
VVTVIGIGLADLLVGAPLTETVFAWPGLGRLLVTAVGQRDLPVVMGAVVLFALAYVLGNLLVDLAPTWPSTRGCAMPARRGPRRHRGFLLGLALLALLATTALLAPALTPYGSLDVAAGAGATLERPHRAHPFGTDALGRGLLARVLWRRRLGEKGGRTT